MRRPMLRTFCSWTVLILASCAPAPERVVATASTIVLAPDGAAVWVTSPDDDAVVAIDPDDGAVIARHEVIGGPEMLAWRDDDHLVITLGRRGAIATLDVRTGAIEERAVPCGRTAAVLVEPASGRTFVSCPDDDRILAVHEDRIDVRAIAGAPAGLALFGDRLGIALSRAGALATISLEAGTSIVDAPIAREVVPMPPGVAASSASAIAAHPRGGLSLLYQRVEHDADRDRDPSRGGYGSVIDGAPRIEPMLRSPCGSRYARFDGGPLSMSGPSAHAIAAGRVWIAHLLTDGVVLARCDAEGEGAIEGTLAVLTTFPVGRAPRGIVVSDDGQTAFVDNGFDWSVSRLDAARATSAVTSPTWARTRPRGVTAMSELALRGRRSFFDAVDTHLTPSGVVSCGTCHPGGGEDGLSWFLHTEGVPRKLRRTPPAWGARTELLPYHWDGQFDDAAVLARATTEELMEGDGLLVDFPAIAAYLAELPLPPPRAPNDPSAVARGRVVFERAGCGDCHAGPLLSDGALHDVLPASADLDANVGPVSTPSLVGVRARSPYFHDGRAPSLADTLAVPGDRHGVTSSTSEDDRADLIAYLESL